MVASRSWDVQVPIPPTRADLEKWRAGLRRASEANKQAELLREQIIDKHGRRYIGIARPKGFRRQGIEQACFYNAARLAIDDLRPCTYVEGFAQAASGLWVHHAWINQDGEHAIDTTWRDAERCRYLGIPFSKKVVSQVIYRRIKTGRRHSAYSGLLDPADFDLLGLVAHG